jgi:threonine/homoserine/homoserine lactone efflux protein
MLEFISRGVQIGITAGTGPGPFQTYTINSALTLGWRKALILCLVPIITDIPLIVLIVFILGALPDPFLYTLQVGGGLFLLWLAWGIVKQWRAGAQIGGTVDASLTQISTLQVLRRGVLMGLISPGPYLFWGTVNGPELIRALNISLLHGAAFLVAFYGSFICLIALTVAIFDRLRSLDPRITRGILLFTAVLLTWFALTTLWQGIDGWRGLLAGATSR